MTAWMHRIVAWPLSMSAAIAFALSVALSTLVVLAIRRRQAHAHFEGNNELVGFTYSVYGVIYGVLLAFTIIVAWERFADTETIVMHEATLLSEIWRDSIAFDEGSRIEIQHDLMAYTQSVIDDEWPTMAAHGQPNATTEEHYGRLWAQTYRIEPETKNQEAYLAELLARMNELSGTRRLRLLHSRLEVNGVLWMVLLIGAIPAVAYTLLFSNKHAWVQAAMTASVMLIVSLSLLVTLSLQHPFSGATGLAPEPFTDLLESFRQRRLIESGRIGP